MKVLSAAVDAADFFIFNKNPSDLKIPRIPNINPLWKQKNSQKSYLFGRIF